MKRIITAIAAAGLLISAGAPAATAADSRTGSKYCGAGYSVGLTSKTTSKGSHVHYYKSDAGQERTFQNGFTATLATQSFYRGVDRWTATTDGFFSSVTANCLRDPA